MKRASSVGHLTPFLPGLEDLLEDPEVSEIMINGPANVWVERGGRLEPNEAPELTAAWLHRAAIHIARPLGLDPACEADPRRTASRTARGSPSARRPHLRRVAITIRRFGGRAFSRRGPRAHGLAARRHPRSGSEHACGPARTSWSPAARARARPRC